MFRLVRGLGAGSILLVLATVLAACGSSPKAVTGAAHGSPITIGFDNQQLGAVAFPDFGAGAQAARQYINAHGGINGHPLEFDNCYTDGTTSASVTCANKFVQAKVPLVLEGIDLGSDAAVPVLTGAGIPLVGHTAFGPLQSNSPDAFFFGAATGAYDAVPLVVMARDLHVRSFTYVVGSGPADEAFVTADLTPVARALGLHFSVIYYNASAPDYPSIVAAASSSHPQALFFIGDEPGCTSFVSAVASTGYRGDVFAGSCSAFVTADASAAEGVFTSTDLYLPGDTQGIPAAKGAQVKLYEAAMERYAPAYVSDAFAQDTFSATMDVASVLRGIKGRISPTSVLSALRSIRDLSSFMGQPLDCNGKQWPGESSACASGLIEYRVEHGRRVAFTHGFVFAKSLV
jgi:branched-chain amino acid transport system substrate-binding protein